MTKNKRVAYFGDGTIGGAATYLSGVMKHYGIDFDRVDSGNSAPDGFFDDPRSLYIISDYPSACFRRGEMERIAELVQNEGSGLLMIGGWESFHGQKGEYDNTVLADVLPVMMSREDDRRNSPLSVILRTVTNHPIVDELPWNTPPGIGGFNAFVPKQDAKLIVEGIRIDLQVLGEGVDDPITAEEIPGVDILPKRRIVIPLFDGDSISVRPLEQVPMLVIGQHGEGRTAAFASDVAPHWVGGFVDWGPGRVTEEIGNDSIEVGENYALFWRNLVRWTAMLNR